MPMLKRMNAPATTEPMLRLLFGQGVNGWSSYTLKLNRVCEVCCGRCDEIEPQRLSGNIWSGEPFVQEQAKSSPQTYLRLRRL